MAAAPRLAGWRASHRLHCLSCPCSSHSATHLGSHKGLPASHPVFQQGALCSRIHSPHSRSEHSAASRCINAGPQSSWQACRSQGSWVQWGCCSKTHRHLHCSAAAEVAQQHSSSSAEAGDVVRQNVVEVLRARGLLQDVTSPGLEAAAKVASLSVYCGFDPTAESLHLGNLLGIIVLSWFQRCGHRPVVLLGGATGLVGDPSGKSAERPVLSPELVAANVAGIRRILESLLMASNGGGPPPLLVNNLDWLGEVKLLEFLRDVGKHARLGTMLSKDSVRSRLDSDSGMSFTEFCYQLLQGADFVHLARTHGVRAQVGGSDQWGNIVAGTELMRKMLGEEAPDCYGLTFPLLTKADGRKFGKSEEGAIWLAAEKLSPFKFYQYLLTSVSDVEVPKFLRMLTFLPLEEVAAIEASMSDAGYVPNTAQRRLAEEVTRFVHGEAGLQQALSATQALAPGAATKLDGAALEAIAEEAPSAALPRGAVVGALVVDVLVAAGMQPSKAAGRRLIKGGGLRVNNEKVSEELAVLTEADLIDGRLVLLAAGKKNKLLLQVT